MPFPGKSVKKDHDFTAITAKFPRDQYSNGIDWEKAMESGLFTPIDHIEGVSLKKSTRPVQQDFAIKPKSAGMSEIIFSHKKHVSWNGCEVCHPDIFAAASGARRSTP